MVTYKRTGKCNPKNCNSFCCRVGAMINIGNSKNQKAYFSKIGYKQLKIGKDTIMVLMHDCTKLSLKGRCMIHKKRPWVCKEFPQSKDVPFYKVAKKMGCSYKFKKEEK